MKVPLRQQLRDLMRFFQMDNTGTMCYANSAVLCLLWSTLSRWNFSLADWGAQSAILSNILLNFSGYPYQLEPQTWFQRIIQLWNPLNEQADCAEFTYKLLGWVASSCISNRWQRRFWQAV